MSLYHLSKEPDALRAPVLIVAFDAWVDAGGAASAAAAHVARGGETIASFDTDVLLDYRTRRPILDVVDGQAKQLTWQELSLQLVRTDALDLLVLTGPEPDHRWKEFASSVLDLALRLGVVRSIALGAIPAAVPHTRPVPLLTTATPPDQLGPDDLRPDGFLRVPAAALSVVQMRFAEHGIPVVGLFAQIPHYVAPVYWAGVVALVERLARLLGVDFPLGSLPDEAHQQRVQLDSFVHERPEVREHVERLESLTPEGGISAGRIPSGDEIAAEVEKFLRRTRDDDP